MPEMPVAVPDAFSASGEDVVGERWWTAFGDGRLDAYIDQALDGNLDLQALRLRIVEANALARRESAAFVPEVEGGVRGEVANSDGEDRSNLELGLAASYEVDLFDRIQATVEAQQFRTAATAMDYEAGAITLVAEVATTFYQLREAELQVALLDEQIASNEKIRQLIAARVATQQLRGVDLLRQDELIEATREQRIIALAEQRLFQNQLAVLVGSAPGVGWTPPPPNNVDLPDLPPPPATGVPIELVRRRPDIRSARLAILAADKDLQVALNSRYPRLNLTADLSTFEDSSGDLFRSWLSSFAAGLFAPLFDGGRRRADMTLTRAIRDRRLMEYGQDVLEAFREVEDALVRESSLRERVASLERQAALSEEAANRLRTDYFNGVGNYIDVLAALTATQRLQREVLTNERLLLDARIALYRALAGGIEAPQEGLKE